MLAGTVLGTEPRTLYYYKYASWLCEGYSCVAHALLGPTAINGVPFVDAVLVFGCCLFLVGVYTSYCSWDGDIGAICALAVGAKVVSSALLNITIPLRG